MKLDKQTIEILVMLLELAVKYGQPAVERLMALWADEGIEVTPELIQKRMDQLPPPETFFENDIGTPDTEPKPEEPFNGK